MNKSLILIGFVVGLSFLLVGGSNTSQNVDLSPSNNQPVSVNINSSAAPNSTSSASEDLQIGTFNGTSSTPPPQSTKTNPVAPSNPCQPDTGQAVGGTGCSCGQDISVTCSNGACTGANAAPQYGADCTVYNNVCGSKYAPGDGTYCYAKPVIYLYPTKPTNVSVKIQTQGKIVVSDPTYPQQTGWQNILAMPGGSLIYQNKAYSELFYESNNDSKINPSSGIVVETSNIKDELYDLTGKLGLIKSEQDELVSYWSPRLEGLNKKYILISLIDKSTKDLTDNVLITPKPDTRIEFLLYFKGLDQKVSIPTLDLPQIPQRVGFTEVEWGGTIDH